MGGQRMRGTPDAGRLARQHPRLGPVEPRAGTGNVAARLAKRALRETGCPRAALARLAAAEARMLAREARAVWGAGHPLAA